MNLAVVSTQLLSFLIFWGFLRDTWVVFNRIDKNYAYERKKIVNYVQYILRYLYCYDVIKNYY